MDRTKELEREIRALHVEMSHVRDNAVSFEQQLKDAKLSLRDQFAMAALSGLLARGVEFKFTDVWVVADGVLAERK